MRILFLVFKETVRQYDVDEKRASQTRVCYSGRAFAQHERGRKFGEGLFLTPACFAEVTLKFTDPDQTRFALSAAS